MVENVLTARIGAVKSRGVGEEGPIRFVLDIGSPCRCRRSILERVESGSVTAATARPSRIDKRKISGSLSYQDYIASPVLIAHYLDSDTNRTLLNP